MLHEFVATHRNELILRCRGRVAKRLGLAQAPPEADQGVPLFLVQLVDTLRRAEATRDGSADLAPPLAARVLGAAAAHGQQMLGLGHGIEHVVRDYGDVCQTVTEMADELGARISAEEFRALNLALDDAIAESVMAFGNARERAHCSDASDATEHLQAIAIELRRLVGVAQHSCAAMRTGRVGINGATGELLAHSLAELKALTTRLLDGPGSKPGG
ncbi:hypothetical protein DSM104443_02236 [Usitatibacter rugosus]|uniref:Chemotaxis protein n=1 Tax=Usitatibacter rugosus TaxID=2732067 RepID=A0A6M4GXF1_9PROT|nr:hypothetical protein [Usitatibacter rugosus]QJR11164.1 hypothetical protein DSM104443_02236 [Usitatibacter rugosus]